MQYRAVSAGCITALVVLFIPKLRVVGPLLGGVAIGVLVVRSDSPEDAARQYVRHGVATGGILAVVYFITVSGMGTSLIIHTVPYEPFLDSSVRTLQFDFRIFVGQITGMDDLGIIPFSFIVGVFAFISTILGIPLGTTLGAQTT